MQRAKNTKNDEFYTQYQDIAAECDHYLNQFRNKVIYCNCDTECSNFVRYFLNLKSQGIIRDVIWSGGLGGIDFRSSESVAMLQQADVVVTNPPFSLFRDFMDLLIEYQKPFLVIGNKNAIAQRKVFDLVKRNKIWPGVRRWAGGMRFVVPDCTDTKEVPAIWLTNLVHNHRAGALRLSVLYDPERFPMYDNADAINVDHTSDIPVDYDGVMGVPISFIEKYNPAQFVILGLDKEFTYDGGACSVRGRKIYTRIFIRKTLAPIAE